MRKTLLAAMLAALAAAPALADPGGCPAGLVKKHNACVPPAPAKKIYRDAVIGHRVPPNANYAIPQQVRATLPRAPYGYRYAVVNDQIVLVSRSNMVVDIVRDIIG